MTIRKQDRIRDNEIIEGNAIRCYWDIRRETALECWKEDEKYYCRISTIKG